MQAPGLPDNEIDRLATLHSLRILDTPADERFDRYARISAKIFDMPIALISLVDGNRQWFKAAEGLEAAQTPRDVSFCGHAILGDGVFEIQNARRDFRFRDNPLVLQQPHIRFYAGAPLEAPNGHKLGTLCLIDRIPRKLGADEKVMLKSLADMIVGELVNYIDTETGLANRNALLINGAKLFRQPVKERRFAALLFDINESIGFLKGTPAPDSPREKFANVLKKHFADAYLSAHVDGNYYCVLLEGESVATAEDMMAQVCREAKSALGTNNERIDCMPLIGCVEFDATRHESINDILRDTDAWFFGRSKKRLREDIESNRFLDAITQWRKSIF